MPLYEYLCKKCHKKFGEVLTIKEHETKKLQCPKCKSKDLEHVIERDWRLKGRPAGCPQRLRARQAVVKLRQILRSRIRVRSPYFHYEE